MRLPDQKSGECWRLRFDSIDEPILGEKWLAVFNEHWAAYQRWYLSEDYRKRPTYRECRKQLGYYMPELLATYDDICELAGGSDWVSRFLSLYCPPRYITGCSQVVWQGAYKASPALIRNYDYHPKLLDAVVLKSAWNGKSTIGMTDCLWGVTDGMNEDGLALSLTFGGSPAVGVGFGIPIILRYILEFCSTVDEAAEVLTHVPTHMTYNITMLDKSGKFLTAFIGPDQPPIIRPVAVATNHQGLNYHDDYHIDTKTLEREQLLNHCFFDANIDEDSMLDMFLHPPLYTCRYNSGFGTVFTSHYRPNSGEIFYYWPYDRWDCSFDTFTDSSRLIYYTSQGAFVEKGFLPIIK